MAYIGTPPSNAFTSLLKQDFSTSATTGYILDHAVNNANDIALFINFVRQEPTAAYSASGTTLTLTSATASSDDMYCVYLGQALQTVNPPNASVGAAQLASDAVTTAKILDANVSLAKLSATGTKDATTFLRGDNTFASAGGVNTPYFYVSSSGNQSTATNTWVKVTLNSEVFDTNNDFASSRFTPTTAGKYLLFSSIYLSSIEADKLILHQIRKNGSEAVIGLKTTAKTDDHTMECFLIADANGSSDYFEVYAMQQSGNTRNLASGNQRFGAFKLIE